MFAAVFVSGLVGPSAVFAATTPSLGAAATYGILGGTFTRNIGVTAITGDVGYTTLSGSGTHTVTGTDYGVGVPTPQARTDAGTALTNLNSQTCTFTFTSGAINLATDTTHGTAGVYTPGVYCTSGAGAASIGTGGITLSGSGTYIFKVNGALTSVDNSNVTLTNGASSCDVFWAPTAATTLGANTTFKGIVIDNANAITVGSLTAWIGRALSLGAGTVTTDTNTINSTCTTASSGGGGQKYGTINVVKTIINDSGGTKTVADFPLFVNGSSVVSGVTNSFPAPALVYTVTETGNANYTQSFSGACDSDGRLTLNPSDNKFCIITNNDIGAPKAIVPPLIDMVKTASPLALPAGPGTVVYTYALRNAGTVPVTDVTIIGDTCSPIILASGDTNANKKLEVNETWVHTCTQTLSKTHTNTAVATGWANGISAIDIASATVVVGASIVPPLIHVEKVPSVFILSAPGGAVIYRYIVKNPGTAPLSDVSITDDKCTGLPGRVMGHPGDLNKNNLLESNESWIFSCKTNLIQTTTNVATASGSANGLTATDLALATVVVASPKLPNTGLSPFETSAPWGTVLIASIFTLIATSLIFKVKKRTA